MLASSFLKKTDARRPFFLCLFVFDLQEVILIYFMSMKKKIMKKEEITNKDLAQMIGTLGKGLDLRISKLESYIEEGFYSLNNKVDYIDTRFSNQIEGLNKRVDNFAENKVSMFSYKELENRVIALEMKILSKSKK